MRSLVRVLSLGGALLALSSTAGADELTPKLRLQGGYTAQRSPAGDTDDVFASATPELTYLTGSRRALVAFTYAFTGTLHTQLANEVANRLTIASAFEATPKTQVLLSAEALQTSLGNYLLVQRTADANIGALPATNTQLLTISTTHGLSYDIDPLLRFTESLNAAYVTSLNPDIEQNSYVAGAGLALDRSWKLDSLGVDLRGQFAHTKVGVGGTLGTPAAPVAPAPGLPVPPTGIDQRIVTVAFGPRWGHDWSRTISTSVTAAGAIAVSPDSDTTPQFAPAGRASILFHEEASGVDVSYAGGFESNILIGTLLQSHRGTVRGYTPLSEKERILASVSLGYLHAKTLDLRSTGALDGEFDTLLSDADVSWQATDKLALVLRYQFADQLEGTGPGAPPRLLRHSLILGLELTSRAPDRGKVPTSFPQRVDRTDAEAPPEGFKDFGK